MDITGYVVPDQAPPTIPRFLHSPWASPGRRDVIAPAASMGHLALGSGMLFPDGQRHVVVPSAEARASLGRNDPRGRDGPAPAHASCPDRVPAHACDFCRAVDATGRCWPTARSQIVQ